MNKSKGIETSEEIDKIWGSGDAEESLKRMNDSEEEGGDFVEEDEEEEEPVGREVGDGAAAGGLVPQRLRRGAARRRVHLWSCGAPAAPARFRIRACSMYYIFRV